MKTIFGVNQFKNPLSSSVVTIGNFDGLHLGHRRIISLITSEGKRLNLPSVVLTFDPHPRQVLSPSPDFRQLFTRNDLIQQLTDLNLDCVVIESFSRELSQLKPDIFFKQYILEPLRPTKIVVGYDFSFGAHRAGNLDLLSQLCSENHIQFEVVSAELMNAQPISSTRIRKSLALGEVDLARQMLGRHFYVEGIVVKGDGRGKTIGFPTANLSLKSETIPLPGVYSGWLKYKGTRYKAVVNIGKNPTFQLADSSVRFEVHVLDFHMDLYGQIVQFEFERRIRDEQRFPSVDALIEQIKKDVVVARKHLADSI